MESRSCRRNTRFGVSRSSQAGIPKPQDDVDGATVLSWGDEHTMMDDFCSSAVSTTTES